MTSGKKTITWLLVIALLSSAVPCTAGRAEAKTGKTSTKKYFMAGKHLYQKLSGNKVMLCGTKQKKGTLVVPAYVTKKGKKYKVTRITGYEMKKVIADKDKITYHDGGISYTADFLKNVKGNKNVHMLSEGKYKKVVFPSTLTHIGEGAFWNCRKVEQVIFASKYSKLVIGKNAFYGCDVEKMRFPKGTIKIGDFAIDPESTYQITIPSTVQKIGYGIVNGNIEKMNFSKKNKMYQYKKGVLYSKNNKKIIGVTGLVKGNYKISSTVKDIAAYGFYNSKIRSIQLPKYMTVIKTKTFAGSRKLKKVNGMKQIKRIKMSAFEDCEQLTAFDNTFGLLQIDRAAFWNMRGFSLTLPSTVRKIDTYAFSACDHCTPMDIKISGNKQFFSQDGCFIKVDGDQKILLAAKPLKVKEFVVPEGVTDIVTPIVPLGGILEKLTFPSTLNYINTEIAVKNGGIINFISKQAPVCGKQTFINSWTFEYRSPVQCRIPKGTKAAYQAAIGKYIDVRYYPAEYVEY